jgi:hypothetical protein
MTACRMAATRKVHTVEEVDEALLGTEGRPGSLNLM